TAASTRTIQGRAGRPPTMVAINEITIATPQGQRCRRHSSHGASPPAYCDSSAPPSAITLATKTKIRKLGAPARMISEKAQHHEPANEHRRSHAGDQHQATLDKVADRLAEPPQQGGEREEPQTARDERCHGKADKV